MTARAKARASCAAPSLQLDPGAARPRRRGARASEWRERGGSLRARAVTDQGQLYGMQIIGRAALTRTPRAKAHGILQEQLRTERSCRHAAPPADSAKTAGLSLTRPALTVARRDPKGQRSAFVRARRALRKTSEQCGYIADKPSNEKG
jgi:hypothetical protein